MAACYFGQVKVVKLLLNNNKFDIHAKNKDEKTSLDWVYLGMKETKNAEKREQYSAIWDMLIKRGGKFNKYNNPQKPLKPHNPNKTINSKHSEKQIFTPSNEETKEDE